MNGKIGENYRFETILTLITLVLVLNTVWRSDTNQDTNLSFNILFKN